MKPFEDDNYTGRNRDGLHPNVPVRLLTASSIIGDKVFNSKDENMGKIKDIMLDIEYGRIEYVIIEFGGFLGLGEKFFAIPFNALQVDPKRQAFIFDQDRKVLEKAPGFDKHHWPETNDHTWQEAQSYWGDFMGPNTGGF
jgi:sporulation protein YlmC with PRC-barrel domain